MIKQQVLFIILLLLSLSILPSCTIFGFGESDVGTEDYYDEGDGDESTEEEISVGVKEEEAAEEVIKDAEEDVYYIDEEDEDIIGEDGVIVEEDPDSDEGEIDGGAEEGYAANEETGGGFFSSDSSDKPEPTSSSPKSSAPKTWIPYKKIKTQPYNQAGFLANAVYIARKGDDIQSISNKIFGADQVSQLHAINLFLKRRGVKVGDKIYYQSPNRPQDSRQLLFYFEDKGIPPQYHQAQAGENIRQIASRLLGDSNSWKEIWATNFDLQSKGVLDQAVTFKYWPEGADVNNQPSPPPVPEPVVPPSGENNMNAEEETETPLPPDPLEEEPALPEQPPQAGTSENNEKIGNKLLSEMDIILAIILGLGAIFCAIIIVRKRNKRKEFDYTATNFKIDED